MAQAYQRTETAIITLEVRTSSGALVDPSTVPVLTVTDPDGTAVVDEEDMNNDGVGLYSFPYDILEDAILGWYWSRYTVTDNALVTIEDDGFEVTE
jgi:uncharacterized protein YfaS (alpha-2-macroglobulin family)